MADPIPSNFDRYQRHPDEDNYYDDWDGGLQRRRQAHRSLQQQELEILRRREHMRREEQMEQMQAYQQQQMLLEQQRGAQFPWGSVLLAVLLAFPVSVVMKSCGGTSMRRNSEDCVHGIHDATYQGVE